MDTMPSRVIIRRPWFVSLSESIGFGLKIVINIQVLGASLLQASHPNFLILAKACHPINCTDDILIKVTFAQM
jgi:hypothetical protein